MVASIPNDVFQFSTWTAVQKGFNSGQPRAADLTSHGTDGIGIFENGNLMALIDSKAYALIDNGESSPAQSSERLCYAMVCNIRARSRRMKIGWVGFISANFVTSPLGHRIPTSAGNQIPVDYEYEST